MLEGIIKMIHQYSKSLHSYNPIPGGCVLYLPLWNPGLQHTTFKSIDSFGRNCTRIGSAWNSTGADLDGTDDRIDIPDSASLSTLTPLSVIVWAKADAQAGNEGFLSKDDGVAGNREWSFYNLGATGRLALVGFHTDGGSIAVQGTADIADTTFHMNAFAWSGVNATSEVALYVDGQPDALTTNTKTGSGWVPFNGTSKVEVGRYAGSNALCFDGTIGEVWIYKKTLSAATILYMYSKTKGRYS